MFITTFYSYKGGVGRTVCLLNVAWELAVREKRVALIDLDLEAPGLHEATLRKVGKGYEKPQAHGGLLQYFKAWQDEVERNDNKPPEKFEQEIPLRTHLGPDGRIALLAAGVEDPDYEQILQEFSWVKFYKKPYYGRFFFENILRSLKMDGFEHVLIDARTGLTDIQFVSTIHLPDLVVLVTNLSAQSIDGTRRALHQIEQVNSACRKGGSVHRREDARSSEIRSLVVGSPIPQGELRKRSDRIAAVEGARGLKRPLDHIVEHLPILAFDEQAQILAQQVNTKSSHARDFGPVRAFVGITDDILRRSKVAAENLVGAGSLMLRVGYWRDAAAFFDAASDLEENHKRQYSDVGFEAALNRARAEAVGQIDPKTVERSLDELAKHLGNDTEFLHPPQQHLALAEGWLTLSWSQVLGEHYAGAASAAERAAEKCNNILAEGGFRLDSSLYADAELLRAYAWYVAGDNRLNEMNWQRATDAFKNALSHYDTMPGFVFQSAMSRVSLSLVYLHQLETAKARHLLDEAEKQLEVVLNSSQGNERNEARDTGDRLWARWAQSAAEVALAEGDLRKTFEYLHTAKEGFKNADSVGSVTVRSRIISINCMYFGLNSNDPTGLSETFEQLNELSSEGDGILVHGIRNECARTLLFAGSEILCAKRLKNSRTSEFVSLKKYYNSLVPSWTDPRKRRDNYIVEDHFLSIVGALMGANDVQQIELKIPDANKVFDIRLWHYVVGALDAIVRDDEPKARDFVSTGLRDSERGPIRIWQGLFGIMARAFADDAAGSVRVDESVRQAAHILLVPRLLKAAPPRLKIARSIGNAIIRELDSLELS